MAQLSDGENNMTKAKYSKSTGGIYPVSAFKTFPDDAKDIPDALYIKFQNAEISRLDVVNGQVVEYVPPPPTPEQLQAKTNAEARAYLASTDWYVVRFAETGVAIPDDVAEARKLARESVK